MSRTLDLDFVPDEGVPQQRTTRPRGAARDPKIEEYVQKMARTRIGTSYFFAGLQPSDLEFLRRPCLAAGIGIKIRRVDRDEIYHLAGVRVWREYGEYDEL